MTLKEMKDILEAEVLTGSNDLNTEIETVCSSDMMSDVLYYCGSSKNAVLVTGLTHPQTVYTAEMAHLKAVIFIRGKKPDAVTIELAKGKNICLLVTHLPKFNSCGRLYENGLRSC